MHRASNAFSVLQATAATVGLAILLWSVGLPSLRFVEAANVTSYSDTLSTSAPSVDANHTIEFTTPTGVASGQTIVITFDAAFNPASVDYTDIDVATSSGANNFSLATDCSGSELASAAFSGDVLTITMCEAGSNIAPNGTTTIEIGTNATHQTNGDQAINNPGAIGSYEISMTAGASDSGTTEVAIVDTVDVQASVDTVFTFTVTGVNTGSMVNGTSTTGSTTPTLINFGQLVANTASTAAQDLAVVTNARNGFVVTVETDQQLSSANGAVIDGFVEGSYTETPTAWAEPTPTLGQPSTYGHWGLTSDDTTYFPSQQTYVSASTTPVEVFAHNGPANGATAGVGTTRVGYTVEVSNLQEAASDYNATLTYVATPVF